MNTTTAVSAWPSIVRCLAARLGVLLLVLAGPAAAAERIVVSDGGGGPFYARIQSGFGITDGVWAAIPLYRPADCIPADFNLLDFVDFRALDCPSYVAGFEIWKNGPLEDPGPIQSLLKAVDPMPILFVRWDELEDAMEDDVLTIGELEELPSLQIGTAAFYQETLHPIQPGRQSVLNIVSSGFLEDGAEFTLHFVDHGGDVSRVSIQFE